MFRFLLNLFNSPRFAICPVCNKKNTSFKPLPDYYRKHAELYSYKYFGRGEMTSHDTYSCLHCGASDRERLYAWWLESQIESGNLRSGASIIHFAPEAALSEKIRRMELFDYVTADFEMKEADFRENIMSLSFKEDSFDFFICSHVLEHVESDDLAIQELFRITKRGGGGILMAPIIVGLESTIEDLSVTSEEERWKLFGQNDHVRLYAHNDYVNKIRTNGFIISELGIEHFGNKTFNLLGLKATSVLYIVKK